MCFLQQGSADGLQILFPCFTQLCPSNIILPILNCPSSGVEESMRVEGNAVRITQEPGWVFGDVALLFNSPRTASVVAATDVVLWAMDRATFLRFVMRHAQGARTLRFVRKVGF
jgi:CRP-like cAMP-binding protein